MNNREKFLASLPDDLRETLAKVFDRANSAQRSGRAMFTDFLSEREYGEFLSRQKNIDSVPCKAFGGYRDAGRVMLCFSEYEESFPISAIRINGRGLEKLKHPDFLGSVLSLGLERKSIGDIVKTGDECVIFAQSNVSEYIAQSLKEVGGVHVNCTCEETENITVETEFENITGTVASLRADSVVSVMLKTSRSKAAEYITGQKFFLNQVLCTKCDKEIKENDILTVRHHGKAKVCEISGLSRKGRIFITIQKYM